MKNIINFSALEIRIASPDTIKSWSFGEVKKPETINYRSLKAEKDGLFDEKIFGPIKDYECYCGKYKRIRYKGIICDKCGVEVTQSKVRRERMAHITLSSPVAHIWFFKGAPSKLSLLLDISPRNLSSIIYFSKYLVLDIDTDEKTEISDRLNVDLVAAQDELKDEAKVGMESVKATLIEDKASLNEKVTSKETLQLKLTEAELKAKNKLVALKKQLEVKLDQTEEIYKTIKLMVKKIGKGMILTEDEYLKLDDYNAVSHLRVGMGAESILELAEAINLDTLVAKLRGEIEESKGAKLVKSIKRLRVAEGLRKAKIKPAWMFMTILPVIPPDLRPMVQLSGGRFATSDLNDLYRRVINRNNRLKHLIDLGAPEIILRNEKRMLQEAVDSLIDGSSARQTRRRQTRRPLKSLSEMLKGKQGRFRQNLLGKRVDYSGRSVIVVGPELKLNECGLPKDMALEMFKPYVLRELIVNGTAPNVKSAKHLIERHEPEVYDILEEVTKNHPVILNRAPTLHKLGMQAFYPILIEGNAIRLHPCVCSGYNADFDGDQMAVHVPLTKKAQQEAIDLLMATNNLLKPANGEPITIPNKEMAMGIYYHTVVDNKFKVFPGIFSSKDEAYHVYQIGKLGLRQLVKVRIASLGKVIETTVGRLQFNDLLPVEFGYINEAVGAKKIKQLVTTAIKEFDKQRVANLIDAIKNLGFEAATISGISVSVSDCEMIENKDEIIEAANKKVEEIQEQYNEGMIAIEERKRLSFDVWIDTTEDIAEKTWSTYSEDNAVKVLIESGGTRASKDQVKQLAAMRGLVVDPNGNIVEMPTKSNFREGLTIFEYVTSARGSRKGLTDSAIKTADAGYLTRRLCDVSHDAIIRLEDCKTEEFITISDEDRTDVFATRIAGRILARDIVLNKKVVAQKGTLITIELAKELVKAGLKTADVRSPLTCEASKGLCATCYGIDFSTSKMIELGVPVGIVAAQSIGEPGTQLTMRTKHSGGILGADVTQGLPRVEELLEARNPKNQAIISEIAGKVSIEEGDKDITVTIRTTSSPVEEVEYKLSVNAELLIKDGDLIHVGQQLTTGSVSLKELALVKGLLQAQQYTINQVQAVYESQGIPIHDKHFETIIRKMCDKLQIESAGDTDFLTGEVIEKTKFIEANDEAMAAGGEPATAKVLFLGITRSSLFTASWLSAASFQHTKNVLTDASAAGKIDYLDGLKENVIIGRLIPTSKERASIEL
ncbi:MAG: DNA-directed RNA polymerase subunit beta' [Candidatus Pacebacteria bacterium CG_4_10_14_3_um_filter_34_15]|nr:DNA-directed RNA polymerase subunit beta' [Candidatus Pacearchaeota archaeon]NCQ65240.1 DNA-directed RNA polymerase subunit beta' [Candidatus Paceibacterota bacterium]OIO45033.1 MAG: DNA-directed RNA polymerase subunit beta' [Candidatus Pacebacteria bacterium CG1_02_43_31]PIQ81019.1 MAG: DNA-directed RNA polymerase subunit beta' [Candidatus Pacebacteria bacterium CG11_big_fil_rev_8_21_14_0_20_34_55]PIX81836.1 MAG: DNA-directed RNA polymerase subunit beta' [Candidatus Pacebacteria bacterium C